MHSQLQSIIKNLSIITSNRSEQSMLSVLMFTDDRGFQVGSLEGRARLKTYLWYHFHKPFAWRTIAQLTNVIYDLGLMAGAESW